MALKRPSIKSPCFIYVSFRINGKFCPLMFASETMSTKTAVKAWVLTRYPEATNIKAEVR